jgi:hypothetical protein
MDYLEVDAGLLDDHGVNVAEHRRLHPWMLHHLSTQENVRGEVYFLSWTGYEKSRGERQWTSPLDASSPARKKRSALEGPSFHPSHKHPTKPFSTYGEPFLDIRSTCSQDSPFLKHALPPRAGDTIRAWRVSLAMVPLTSTPHVLHPAHGSHGDNR